MDAPPEREDAGRFVRLGRLFREAGLNVPEIRAADLDRGFVLMEDLGDRLYLRALAEENVDRLYGDAVGALITLHVGCPPEVAGLPPYDRALLERELGLFRDWLVGEHLAIVPEPKEEALLAQCFEGLIATALAQPRVTVHRDFHSRNLMVRARHNPGILDFQDAVAGPVTYDLVSLLRDCYIAWPEHRVIDWAQGFHRLALQSGVLREEDEDEDRFLRWFDWMGVQRHLKAAGIFARLSRRDGKPGFLADIPRTLGYVLAVCARYPELNDFGEWLEGRIAPHTGIEWPAPARSTPSPRGP
jgi:aminoglycoside/choline kinase family phosphotransferase